MEVKILVLAAYFAMVLILGFMAKSRLRDSPSQYFLAGRGLAPFILLGSMAATNFSAFTVFGASGAGYLDGLAFFPVMAFGTGFMALTFWLVGSKVWEMGRKYNLVTPAELVGRIYAHRGLSALFAIVMVVFTIPYIALQPMAAGGLLNKLFGLEPWKGAGLITLILVVYTLRGGLKAVAWTDVFQGLLMVSLMIAALSIVAGHHGGWSDAFGQALEQSPQHFTRLGGRGRYGPGVFFGFVLLWFFCDPMFPQLFQRFFAAKEKRALGATMLFYPLICTVVFALPIALGLLGRLSHPGLTGKAAEDILSLLMTSLGGDFMGTLVLAAGLAALMSTMDSQLLTLSSIFTRDLYPLLSGGKEAGNLAGRVFVLLLALAGCLMAVASDASILKLGLTAFTGLAVLFPTVFFGLYLKNPRPEAAIFSILAGEALVLAYHLKVMPQLGLWPAVVVILASTGVYLAVHIMVCLVKGSVPLPRISGRKIGFSLAFAGIFLAAQDIWPWSNLGGILWGWPLWAWTFVGFSALQTLLMAFWLKDKT